MVAQSRRPVNFVGDIRFLEQFRATVAQYLAGSDVSGTSDGSFFSHTAYRRLVLQGRYEELRQAIAQDKRRAHTLLAEYGCEYLVNETRQHIATGSAKQQSYKLFDLLLDNPLPCNLSPKVFLEPIDDAIGAIRWQREMEQLATSPEPKRIASPNSDVDNAVGMLRLLARRFPRVAAELGNRQKERASFIVRDEYDVQDLFRALLRLVFDDVRPEEPVPSHAGTSSRIDFLLAEHKVGIEVKMTRDTLGQRAVRDQLLVDFAQYRKHPDCKTIVAFVYDPSKRIRNPSAFETDLSVTTDGVPVHVFVVQG